MPHPIPLSTIICPACQGPVIPVQLRCHPCDLTVAGHFTTSEFSSLGAEDLHFLRIFVHCEGSIREMESALGLSYPTIKSRLANLKRRLMLDTVPAEPDSVPPVRTHSYRTVDQVLTALENGTIDHADSLVLIKKLK